MTASFNHRIQHSDGREIFVQGLYEKLQKNQFETINDQSEVKNISAAGESSRLSQKDEALLVLGRADLISSTLLQEPLDEEQNVKVAEMFSSAAKVLLQHDLCQEAEQLQRRGLAIYEHLYKDVHPTIAMALYELANMCKVQQAYEEAQALLTRAYIISIRTSGQDHPDTILILCDIGYVYAAQGLLMEAEMLYKRALSHCEVVLGPEHTFTLIILDNLASLYAERANTAISTSTELEAKSANEDEDEDGITSQPETLLQGIDSLYTRAAGLSSRDSAKILRKLALAYTVLDQWEKAEAAYKHLLTVYEDAVSEPLSAALCLEYLAFLYLRQGRADEAEIYFRRTLQIRERLLGTRHSDFAASLNNLAQLYITQEKFEQAERLLDRALIICTEEFGEVHDTVVIALNNLLVAYLGQGKQEQATSLLAREQLILEKLLGPGHPEAIAVREHYQKLRAS